jgi:glycosyltransferase involved in cell wall biosynthesis
VKSGIRRATGEFVLILDGDGQHKPEDACRLVAALGDYDLVVGARDPATQASGRRRVGNAVLNWLAGFLAGRSIPDLTSGFRAMRREHVREFLGLLPNGFSSPTTITLSFIRAGYSVRFEPVQARQRSGQSKIRFARDGVKFFLILLRVITIFSPLRIFLPLSLLSFAIGVAYGIWNVFRDRHIPNGAVLAIMFAVIVFLVGLVSEQIAALRASQRG